MKIVFVSSVSGEGTGGSESYLRYVSAALGKEHEVTSVARVREKLSPSLEFHRTDGASYLTAPPALRPVLQLLAQKFPVPQVQPVALALLEKVYGKQLDVRLSHKPEIVHYVGGAWDALGFPALHAARRAGSRFAITPFLHVGHWADTPLDLKLYREADLIFACSEWERTFLIENGVAAQRVQRMGLGADDAPLGDAARFRATYGLGERPLILFAGRRQKYKGYHALCEAMPQILKSVPDACLVALGTSMEPPYPPVPERNLLDLGRTDDLTKADAFAAATVFCMPSEAESFGIVYAEAWRNGVPVIAGNAPALQELIEHGKTGYRVEKQSPTQIAEYAVAFLTNDALRTKLGEAGRKLQAERYTWAACAKTHHDAYFASKHTAV